MPRSWNESSSANAKASDTSPNRKLSVMNARSSAVRGSMTDLEMVDEAIEHDLGGEDRDQRHVVFLRDGFAGAVFSEQQFDGSRIENPIAPKLIGRQQIAHVAPGAAGE